MAVTWETSIYWEIFFEKLELQTYSFLMMDNLGSYFDFQILPPGFTSHGIACASSLNSQNEDQKKEKKKESDPQI